MKKLSFLLVVIFLGITAFSQKYDISYNLDKGADYKLNTNYSSKITQEINGQIMQIDLSLESLINFHVNEIQDSQYIMDVQYKSVSMETTVRGQTMRFSSENDNEHDIMSKLLSMMTERSFSFTMNRNGSIDKILGMTELWNGIMDSLPEIPEADKNQLKQQLEKSYGNESFRNSVGSSLHIFPDFSVTKGERWWVESTIGAGMVPAEMECDYILADATDESYKILGNSYLKTDKEKSSTMNGMETFYDLRGEYTSEIYVDRKTGWIKSSNVRYFLEGNLMINSGPQGTERMTVPLRMNGTAHIGSE